MFAIQKAIEATLCSVANRVEKHGDEDVPAVSIRVAIEAPNTLLDAFGEGLREALYKADGAQSLLPGVEASLPILRFHGIDTVSLTAKGEGWKLRIDSCADESDQMEFAAVKVDKFSVEPHNGGSITLRFRLGTSDVDEGRMGWLAVHNGQSIWLTLLPPSMQDPPIDGTQDAFDADHPGAATAEDLFAKDRSDDPADDGDWRISEDEIREAFADHDDADAPSITPPTEEDNQRALRRRSKAASKAGA